jgi:DNA-directed RNA polymerase specialized sigma24 family protein
MARTKLSRGSGFVDSQDVFASVARRLDQLASGAGVRPRSEAELWALVRTVTTNTAIEKTRLVARVRSFASTEGLYGQELLKRLEECGGDDEATLLVHRMALSLTVAVDRQIMFLFLRGATFSAMGVALQMSEDAVRKRWARLRDALEERFIDGQLDD